MTEALVLDGPDAPVDAVVNVPGSKSQANRALVCAFLASGQSRLGNVPTGDDTAALVGVMRRSNAVTIGDSIIHVEGGSPDRLPSTVWCELAGTTSRFLTALGTLCMHEVVVDGGEALRNRPMRDLHRALRELGARVDSLGVEDRLPVSVGGGPPTGSRVAIRGDVSSQFISSLMLIAPCLDDGIEIVVDGPLVSAPYVEMTANVMRAFGAVVDTTADLIRVSGTGYTGCSYSIEPDYSSAAFPIVAATVCGGRVRLPGLGVSRLQGDSRILEIISRMGAQWERTDDDIVVTRNPSHHLAPISEDMSECSDLVPVVATACLEAEGESVITGVGFIRDKESNRLEDLASELRRLGGDVLATEDGLRIRGGKPLKPAVLGTHHDHRLAMSFAILSSRVPGITIEDPDVVSKSWPRYFEDMIPIIGRPAGRTVGFYR